MADVSVLVPYRPDGGWRDRAWAWISQRWETTGFEVVVESPGPGVSAADFNHPRAINRAAARASGSMFIVADADTTPDWGWLAHALRYIQFGPAMWALPQRYVKLTKDYTEILLGRWPGVRTINDVEAEWIGDAVSWSGLVVVPRAGFELVGGYDERWERWGGDDVAFTCALKTLWGPVTRVHGAALHFWHPRDGLDAQPQAQHDLMYRYLEAEGDVEAMRELIRR